MAEEDQLGWGAVFVELRDEGFQYVGVGERRIGFRAEGVVAPVLMRAEEEHLHAELARLVRNGEDIGFLDAARDGVAARLYEGEGGEAVAQEGRALEVERFGRLVHVGLQMVLH